MNRSDEHKHGVRHAPSDLGEQFRELQRLRRKVQDLERRAATDRRRSELDKTNDRRRRE